MTNTCTGGGGPTDTGTEPDTGTEDTGTEDSGTPEDTGTEDTGTDDTGTEDTGTQDTGTEDTGTEDTSTPEDTGAEDTGTQDTGTQDTGTEDTGTEDTSTPQDTGTQDTGTQDTGTQDTGTQDTSPPDSGMDNPIGGSCTDADDCTSGGCVTSVYPGGYCTAGCNTSTSSGSCPSGSHCGLTGSSDSGICLESCTQDSDCGRSDYSCLDTDNDGNSECYPVGSGSTDVGGSCSVVTDCSGGENGDCVSEGTTYKGGYCTWRFCNASNSCPSGSHCSFDSSGDGYCLKDCSTDGDCRTSGYSCYDVDGDSTDECYVAGTGSQSVGESCQGLWECDSGENASCPNNHHFTDGYCLKTGCGNSGVSCGSGTHCVFSSTTSSACFQDCTFDSDCSRSGYSCFDVDGDFDQECYPAGTGSKGVGSTCQTTADCSGGDWAYCARDLFADGYCSKYCGNGQGSCGPDSTCFTFNSQNIDLCLQDCTTDADCTRSGYSCSSQHSVCLPSGP